MGDVIQVGQVQVRFRLEKEQTGGSLTMFEFRVPPRARVPVPHYHETFDETAYGLEGALTFTIGGQKTELKPGDVAFIPRGVVHGFENLGETDALVLSAITPGILGPEFFREIGEAVNAGGPPDIQRIIAIMLRHGLRPVMPGSQEQKPAANV